FLFLFLLTVTSYLCFSTLSLHDALPISICWYCCWYVASKSSFVTSPSFTSATISGIPSISVSGISGCSSFALSSLLSSPHAASTPIINTRNNINNHYFHNINTPFLIMWCHSNTILCVVKNYISHYILLLNSYLLLMLYDYTSVA